MEGSIPTSLYDTGNLAMTYVALASLLILGDTLERVDREGIKNLVKLLAQQNGRFSSFYRSFCNYLDGESDMRFVYCACIVCDILKDWTCLDKEKVKKFIHSCQTYDGGISQMPYQESHGGSTYCAVASLALMGNVEIIDKRRLIKWCLERQVTGFQGRANKDCDTCYSFWIGSALKVHF